MSRRTIIRKAKDKENPYVMVDRAMLSDPNISWEATGFLAYLSLFPNKEIFDTAELARQAIDGEQVVIVNELIAAGYLKEVKK